MNERSDQKVVDLMEMLFTRKVIHEQKDYVTCDLVKIARRAVQKSTQNSMVYICPVSSEQIWVRKCAKWGTKSAWWDVQEMPWAIV